MLMILGVFIGAAIAAAGHFFMFVWVADEFGERVFVVVFVLYFFGVTMAVFSLSSEVECDWIVCKDVTTEARQQ